MKRSKLTNYFTDSFGVKQMKVGIPFPEKFEAQFNFLDFGRRPDKIILARKQNSRASCTQSNNETPLGSIKLKVSREPIRFL